MNRPSPTQALTTLDHSSSNEDAAPLSATAASSRVRAIHIEIAHSFDTDSFVNASQKRGIFLAFQPTDSVAHGMCMGAHDQDDSRGAQRVDSRADLGR